jgi:hypothetical protein
MGSVTEVFMDKTTIVVANGIAALTLLAFTVAPRQPVIYLPLVENGATPSPTVTTTPTPSPTAMPPVIVCTADTYNCNDFSTQPEAQAVFDYCYAQTGIDIHRLDQDNDLIACESLPLYPLTWEVIRPSTTHVLQPWVVDCLHPMAAEGTPALLTGRAPGKYCGYAGGDQQ